MQYTYTPLKTVLKIRINEEIIPKSSGPTNGGAVLLSKLVDERCQVKSSVVLVDLAVRSFPWFTPKLV